MLKDPQIMAGVWLVIFYIVCLILARQVCVCVCTNICGSLCAYMQFYILVFEECHLDVFICFCAKSLSG